ncbi:MAG: hypothetical protein IJI84_05290 [Clostridia bacterium]|nr:hypothetical protein [Clostridia bacterium]
MDDKKKKAEKLDMDELGRVAGGLTIGGRRFNSAVINEDLSQGDVDINLNIGGKKAHGHAYGLENGSIEIIKHDSDDSVTEDAESANVELFPDENLIPFDPN